MAQALPPASAASCFALARGVRPERDIVSGLEKVAGHRVAHQPKSEKSEFCHNSELYMSLESLVLASCADTLRQHTGRIEVCLGKLTDDQVWVRGHANENAVGNLALHLAGNVRQWIISGLGGRPDSRIRDREFAAAGGSTAADLSRNLRDTVEEAIAVISSLTSEGLTRQYRIQEYDVSGVEALLHVVEHFAGHTGQIIFATKFLTGEDLGFYRHLNP